MSVEEVFAEKIDKTEDKENVKPSYSLETLALLVNKQRVDELEGKLKTHFKDLKKLQEEIKALQSLVRTLNAATDDNENLDLDKSAEAKELYELMDKRFDLKLPNKTKFNGSARERMVDNIKMAIDERNLENDLLMNTIQQLNSERNESFQLANKIVKTLHDAKMRQTQALSGR